MAVFSLKSDLITEILSNSDVVVKSQQMGEPEMTLEEKRTFLDDFIEQKKASLFLARFGKFLKPDHLEFFRSRHGGDMDEKYCIEFHIKELERNAKPKASTVRNRRFSALQKLLDGKDDYFSEQEMMRREPVLYEHLVGQYMTDGEKQLRDRCENPTFLGALLKGIEMEHFRVSQNKSIAAAPIPSGDSMDSQMSNDDEESQEPIPSTSLWGEFDDAPRKPERPKKTMKNVSESDRDEMKKEFIETMYHKFMSGDDAEFNYAAVDNNTEYDDLEMEDQDEQDKYFEESDSLSEECEKASVTNGQ